MPGERRLPIAVCGQGGVDDGLHLGLGQPGAAGVEQRHVRRLDERSPTKEHFWLPAAELHAVLDVPAASLDQPLPLQPVVRRHPGVLLAIRKGCVTARC